MEKIEIMFGSILRFDAQKNKGKLYIPKERREFDFSLNSQRAIVAGFSVPEFAATAPDSSLMPQRGAQVVVLLKTDYDREIRRDRRILQRIVTLEAWGYAFEYNDARKAIAARPQFEVQVQVQVAHPCPLSKGVVTEPFRPTNGEGSLLATETELLALAAGAGGKRKGTLTLQPA